MSMTNVERFEDSRYEKPASVRLMEYLQGKCGDAIRMQAASTLRGDTAIHGAFIRRVPGERKAHFLMKPPHPNDVQGTFARIEVVFPPSYEPVNFFDMDGSEIQNFIIQKTTDGLAGPEWLVSEHGVSSAELIMDRPDDSTVNLPEELAEQLLEELSGYNNAADSEFLDS